MGRSGGLITEGAGVFAVIRAWLVGGKEYAPGCTVVTVSPVGLPSGTESSWASALDSVCWGIFVGRFHQHGGSILDAGLLLWVDG